MELNISNFNRGSGFILSHSWYVVTSKIVSEGVPSVIAVEYIDDLLVGACRSEVGMLQGCSVWVFGW